MTGKNVQDHEFIYPFYRLQEDGFEVDVATDGKTEVMGQLGAAKVTPTLGLDNLDPAEFQVLVLPGGAKCMEYMRQDKRIIEFISAFHDSGASDWKHLPCGLLVDFCKGGGRTKYIGVLQYTRRY